MSKSTLKRAFGGMILGVVSVLSTPAVGAAEETIPVEVVLELLKVRAQYGGGPPTLLIGTAPPELAEILPEDLGVDVSVIWDKGSSVIARSGLTRTQLLGQLEAAFTERGWSRFRPETSTTGFQPSTEEEGMILCHEDGATISVEAEPKGEEETSARLSYIAGSGFSSCDKMSQYEAMENLFGAEVPLPTLHPPEGAKSRGGGGGSGGDLERRASTRLKTDLSSGDVLVHYAPQMGQQGWQPDSVIDYDSLAYQSWILLDDAGKEWHALLTAARSLYDETQMEVEIEVRFLGEG